MRGAHSATAVVLPRSREAIGERLGWSEQVNAAIFLVLLFWPHSLADRQLGLAAMMIISLIALLNQPLRVLRLSAPLVAFFAYFGIVIGAQALSGGLDRYALSQSNHLVQFAIYYFAFSKIIQGCDWARIITSRTFLVAATVVSILYGGYFASIVAGSANQSDVSITLIALMLGLFIRGEQHKPLLHFIGIAAIALLILVITGRASVLLILVVLPIMYWLKLSRLATSLVVATILLLPVAFYLSLDQRGVLWLYQLDHNTGIRADFVRGAASLLKQSPFFGIGFGDAYRPPNFAYASRHPLLNDVDAIHIVPNHHSLFDVALRLGIPAALICWWGIFQFSPKARDNRVFAVLAVLAAAELSFNAWLENQYMLPQFALVVALMHAGVRRASTGAPQALVGTVGRVEVAMARPVRAMTGDRPAGPASAGG